MSDYLYTATQGAIYHYYNLINENSKVVFNIVISYSR